MKILAAILALSVVAGCNGDGYSQSSRSLESDPYTNTY